MARMVRYLRVKTIDDLMQRTAAEGECLVWQGSFRDGQYGQVWVDGEGNYLAHRLAYELSSGTKLSGSECVLHSCDNPACINPDHLFKGSRSDNHRDMCVKKRNYCATLSESDAIKIRELYAETNMRQSDIGEIYGVSPSHVGEIVRGEKWSNVSGPITVGNRNDQRRRK